MEDIELIIENKRKELDILEDEYYDIKNKKAVDDLKSHIGKCYVLRRNKQNITRIIYVNGYGESYEIGEQLFVDELQYEIMRNDELRLISYFNNNCASKYFENKDLYNYDIEEITKDEYNEYLNKLIKNLETLSKI